MHNSIFYISDECGNRTLFKRFCDAWGRYKKLEKRNAERYNIVEAPVYFGDWTDRWSGLYVPPDFVYFVKGCTHGIEYAMDEEAAYALHTNRSYSTISREQIRKLVKTIDEIMRVPCI